MPPAQLPKEILAYLIQRHAEMSKQGSWIEGHYRPGQGPRGPKRRKREAFAALVLVFAALVLVFAEEREEICLFPPLSIIYI